MDNLMQPFSLRVSEILDHAARYHPRRKIISRNVEGPVVETNWSSVRTKAKKLSKALQKLDIKKGDRIGVMAWNTARHLELWYGIPGSGAINHTLNPRLFIKQLTYIINHAEDKILMVDLDLIKILEEILPTCKTVKHAIILTDKANMPASNSPNLICYEELVSNEDSDFEWVNGHETEACGICYTSGTTGNPKGVVYTHRSNVLHALTSATPDMINLSSTDRIMPVVPLFHANGWSIGYTAPLVGASMVMPGKEMTPEALYEMLEKGVTVTAAVPTIWLLLLNYLKEKKLKLSSLKRVIIGGSSCPKAVIEAFQKDFGVNVLHAWGMTEMSPLGTICSFKPEVLELSEEEKISVQETTGHPPFTVELKLTGDNGNQLKNDGKTQGKLWARGAAVVQKYLKFDEKAVDNDGWFDTGDVATIDENGYMSITDRSKDIIKSGGEWISSIELENAAVGHPKIVEAAAIGVFHPKWDERPILVVVCEKGIQVKEKEITDFMSGYVAKWQIPDDIIFVDEIPHTATGKISKMGLRKILENQNYQHPDIQQ
ncbi:MAG: long-chain fatty acid--CoA ligase [Rhodobacteraceae bacterium]|nr:MAG: long-chain fatty acid--CoA ligase [Paracoccaceae bacterium]